VADVSGHSKIRVLVDSCWNNAGYISSLSIYMRERVAETWGGLNGRESEFTNVV
jgi:hypothetical protein